VARFANVIVGDTNEMDTADGYVIASGEKPPPPHGAGPGVLLVAGPVPTEEEHRIALKIGAAAFVHSNMAHGDLLAVWAAALAGYYPLPRATAHPLVSRLERPPENIHLSDRDKVILAGLAQGDTMAEVAARLGCSERHARRQARAMWNTLGVPNRTQGLVSAARWGLLS